MPDLGTGPIELKQGTSVKEWVIRGLIGVVGLLAPAWFKSVEKTKETVQSQGEILSKMTEQQKYMYLTQADLVEANKRLANEQAHLNAQLELKQDKRIKQP